MTVQPTNWIGAVQAIIWGMQLGGSIVQTVSSTEMNAKTHFIVLCHVNARPTRLCYQLVLSLFVKRTRDFISAVSSGPSEYPVWMALPHCIANRADVPLLTHYCQCHVCRRLLQKIPSVTVDDLRRVGSQYVASLFDAARSKVAVCCHPTKVDETVSELLSWWVDCIQMDLEGKCAGPYWPNWLLGVLDLWQMSRSIKCLYSQRSNLRRWRVSE